MAQNKSVTMAPSRKCKRESDRRGVDEKGEIDTKRPRTADTSINEEDSHNPALDPVASASASASATETETETETGSGNAVAVAVTTNSNIDNNELPTTEKLSEELCSIISDRYSREEALRTLERLHKWAKTQDSGFLTSFHVCNGVQSVLNFIKKTMNDGNCVGQVRIECIEKAVAVITNSTHSGRNKVNMGITMKIATSFVKHDGINTLINVSEEYSSRGDVPQLKVLRCVWGALRNITCRTDTMKDAINKDQAITLFDTGIFVISQLKSVDSDNDSSYALGNVFSACIHIVMTNYVAKKYFQDKDILPKCLEVFKKEDTWTFSSEKLMIDGIKFFYGCCFKNLLDKSSDYEMLLPFLVMVLKKYPSNNEIRTIAIAMIDVACSAVNDRTIVETSAMEVLGGILVSDAINAAEKYTIRTLIHKITAP
jgi:hypothetical protein